MNLIILTIIKKNKIVRINHLKIILKKILKKIKKYNGKNKGHKSNKFECIRNNIKIIKFYKEDMYI